MSKVIIIGLVADLPEELGDLESDGWRSYDLADIEYSLALSECTPRGWHWFLDLVVPEKSDGRYRISPPQGKIPLSFFDMVDWRASFATYRGTRCEITHVSVGEMYSPIDNPGLEEWAAFQGSRQLRVLI